MNSNDRSIGLATLAGILGMCFLVAVAVAMSAH